MQAELVKGERCRCLVSKRPSHLQMEAPSPACFAPELGMPGLSLAASQPAEHESVVASLSPHQIQSTRV